MKKRLKINSSNGVDKLNVILWEVENPVGILQIAHGMIEYIDRYDRFARFMNEQGFVVVGNDHLGHGDTAANDDDLGYMNGDRVDELIIKDLHRVSVAVKKRYKDIPFFLMGHSMGSFLARRYAMSYGDELSGLIAMGTGEDSALSTSIGKVLVSINSLIFGERHRSKFLEAAMLGRYNLKFLKEGSSRSWISKNVENQEQSGADKYCSYMFTNKGYKMLLNTLKYISNPMHVCLIPDDLPVLFISGADDPVGNFKKGVDLAALRMMDSGVSDVEITFYEELRHEILNEEEYELVHLDILDWIKLHM
ncbi:MAG: lysophospholipase [Lachnospiraceae bacterium]|nr:lysophospholipase [Lachnospiraceae bacterium]